MAVGHLGLEAPGDCHVKGACMDGDTVFAIKMITGFHHNPERGLPVAHGFSTVFSAVTGEVLAVLNDQGRLTDIRTAAAGAVAARAVARRGSKVLGVIGTGLQAGLQARWISRALGLDVLVWGRDPEAAAALAQTVGGRAVTLGALCEQADLIVTATTATAPVLLDAQVRPGTRILALGADAPGKNELDPAILARARVIVDSRGQCIDHGDTAWAIGAGLIAETDLMELGELLAAPIAFGDEEIVVVDMTGVGVLDLQIAKAVWARISQPRSAGRWSP